jgi:hypothetical protein
MLDVIWREHGLGVPPAPSRPRIVDWAMGHTTRLDEAQTTADVLEGAARWIGGIAKMVVGLARGDEPPHLHEEDEFVIGTGHDYVEVELDPDAEPALRAMGKNPLTFTSRTVAGAFLELREGSDDAVEVWDRPPGSKVGQRRLGELSTAEASPYRRLLAASRRVDQALVCHGLRVASSGGSWRLYVGLPRSSDDRS